MPSVVVGGALAVVGKLAAAKTFAIGFAVAFKAFAYGAVSTFALSKLSESLVKKPSRPTSRTADGVAGSTRGLVGSTIPKRWVVGRARVTGGLVWFREDDRYKYEVRVLSAGSCDGIERVWAHGDEVEMERNGNVLTPVSNSRYWGTREESYTETYQERVPIGGSGGDGRDTGPTPDRPGGGRESACGGCRSCAASSGCADGTAPGTANNFASDGLWTGEISSNNGRGIDMSPWAMSRYAEAVSGTSASAGAAASDGVGGQQGEGGGNRPGEEGGRSNFGGGGEGGGRDFSRPSRPSSYTVVTRTRTRTRTVRVPLIKITEYFKADGTEGAEIRTLATGVDEETELPWTDAYKGNGVSYVLIELYQPDYGNEIDNRFWPGPPVIHFLLRGIKVSYPVADTTASNGRRLTAPAWTDNAAVLRYWYLTERRNIAPELIDLEHFNSARLLCDEELSLANAPGYTADYPDSVKRYTINGAVTSGDSAAALDAQMDFAWQGFVVEAGGNLLFRPGSNQPSRFRITEDNIIADPEVRTFNSRSDLANELSVAIEQSTGEDFQVEYFNVVDSAAQASDGERLPQELTQLKFINEPVQAINFLHQRLIQQRGLVSVRLEVKSPPDWRYHELIAGDKIELILPEHGIGVEGARLRYFRVNGVQVKDDFSVMLNLLEWPDDLYQDQFEFPPRQRKFNVQPKIPPAPAGSGVIDWNIVQDGSVVWTAFLSWDAEPYETTIRVTGNNANAQVIRTRENSVSIDLTQAGSYTFNLRHVDASGIASAQSQVVLEATYDDISLPRPVVLDALQNGNLIVIRVENVPNRDIDGLDVRFRSRGLDANFADIPVITEADWDEAPQMSVSPVVPSDRNNPIFAYAVLPASGTYRIYVRLRNRVGNLSPISNVIDARFEIVASNTGSQTEQPDWSGDFNNALQWTHDGEHRVFTDSNDLITTIPMTQWDGESDFPFGEHTGFGVMNSQTENKTTYTTVPYAFEDASRREVYVAIETDTPDGKLATDPAGFEITLLHSSSALDDNGELVNPTSVIVDDGAVSDLPNVHAAQAVINFYEQRNHALIAVTLGWRDIG